MFTRRTALSMNAKVIAAQAGIQFRNHDLGPGLRRGDD